MARCHPKISRASGASTRTSWFTAGPGWRPSGSSSTCSGRSRSECRSALARSGGASNGSTRRSSGNTTWAESRQCRQTAARRSRRSGANEFFEIEADDLEQHIRDARDYVENYLPKVAKAELLAVESCEDRWVQPCDADRALYLQLLQIRAAHEVLSHEKERLETELRLIIGRAQGLEGLASWKAVESNRFDGEAFRADRPICTSST